MSEDNGTCSMWSDDDLDQSLQQLGENTPVNNQAVPAAYTTLMTAARQVATPKSASPTEPGRSRTRLNKPANRRSRPLLRGLIAAVIAAVLIGGALLAPTWFSGNGGHPNSSAAAAEAFNHAAIAIGSNDPPIKPGQYRYIHSESWSANFAHDAVWLSEQFVSEWVPADPADPDAPWMLVNQPTGNKIWIRGSASQVLAEDPLIAAAPAKTYRAACGDFFEQGGCGRPGSWQDPSPVFLAGLPRDPDQLYQRLLAAIPDNGSRPARILTYVTDTLATGLVPADLRAALYHVLARIPGIEITDHAANLAGRQGTALGVDDGQVRKDIIIDTLTGTFIGYCQALTAPEGSAPAGTTTVSTAVTTGIADHFGVPPRR